jgi:SWI/SNF-related matrix-associated actin-dependent regulator 1 of chromatin subfamily A
MHLEGLDPHQAAAVPWLLNRPYAMLAWEMGVGKTAPLVRAWQISADKGPLLIICLASARENWRREVIKSGIDPAWPPRIELIYNHKNPIDPRAEVVICNYHKLSNVMIMRRLRAVRWGAIVIDEAHALKNSEAERTKLIYGIGVASHKHGPLVEKTDRVWLATGTPTPNHPGELYTHAATLWPDRMQYNGHTMAQWEFEAAFCDIRQTKYGMQVVGARNLGELRDRLGDVISVIKRADVLDLPPLGITSWPLDAEMGRQGRAFHDVPDLPELLGSLVKRFGPPERIDTFDAATLAAYLACIDAEIVMLATLRQQLSVAKAVAVALMVDEELDCDAHKTVIFAHHREAIATLTKALARHRPAVIHGAVPPAARQGEIDRFQSDPACRVFIGQITAAGSSINLQAACHVVFVEASWVPGENDQAISRVYRRGQVQPVWVRFAFIPNTVDEAVARALARKATMQVF